MDIPIVHPSPILRRTLLERYKNVDPSPKRVQFESENEINEQNDEEMTKKRKVSRGGSRMNRDSLKIRYRTGKPGTRRHQRWSNEMFLGYDWSDLSESEIEEDIFEIFQEIHERPHFSFTETFHQNSQTLEEFWYSAQWDDDVLATSANRTNHFSSQNFANPDARFRKIPRKSRVHLEKYSDSPFVKDLENELQNYVKFLSEPVDFTGQMNRTYHSSSTSFKASWKDGALVIYFQDSLARLMAHGLCKYYALESQSWNDEDSLRATTIKLPSNNVPLLPEISLRDYFATFQDSEDDD